MTLDEKYMTMALKQAQKAMAQDEVPIGAVIVSDGKVIARAHNTRNKSKRATAHAELLAIDKACKKLNDWRLNGCTLYVTLEPCLMCLGACYNARVDKVIYGATDNNGGDKAIQLADQLTKVNTLNHNLNVQGGILQEQCSAILTEYFKGKRNKPKPCQSTTEN